MNMFEYASRNKVRFMTNKGNITVEDLWVLPLTSDKFISLNMLAKASNKIIKSNEEEDFVSDTTQVNTLEQTKLDIIKYIIKVKKEINANEKLRIANRAKKEQILSLIANKQNDKLAEKSETELKALLEDL